MAWALLDLGRAARASGDNVAAQRAFSEGLQLAQDTKSHVIVQKVSEELAAVNMEA